MLEVSKTLFTLYVIQSHNHQSLSLNRRCFDVESSLHCFGLRLFAWTLPSFLYNVASSFVSHSAVIQNALYQLLDSLTVNLCPPIATSSSHSSFQFFSLLPFEQWRDSSWVAHFLVRNHISHIYDASLDPTLKAFFLYCYKPCTLP